MKYVKHLIGLLLAIQFAFSLAAPAFAEEYDLAQGSIEVTANDSGQYVSQVDAGHVDVQQTTPTVITQSNPETSTINNITVTAEDGATAEITLDGVNINGIRDPSTGMTATALAFKGEGTLEIELDGDNKLEAGNAHAAVHKYMNDSELIIKDDTGTEGSLYAQGGYYSAGIGGGYYNAGNNITINGGNITAIGGSEGAGIGGGLKGWGSNVTINGGNVTAIGGGQGWTAGAGAGIGGGNYASASNIKITGGNVTASCQNKDKTRGSCGAGIGAAYSKDVSNIEISGDAVVKVISSQDGGACIGTGAQLPKNGVAQNPGTEYAPDTSKLTANGRVEYYNCGEDEPFKVVKGSYVPLADLSWPDGENEGFLLYSVNAIDGGRIDYVEDRVDGILTINVDDADAMLSIYSAKLLISGGVKEIIFITDELITEIKLQEYTDAPLPLVVRHEGTGKTITADGEPIELD